LNGIGGASSGAMKKLRVSLILIATAVGACESGGMAWSKADATPQEFVRTRSQCNFQSIRASYNLGGSLDRLFDPGRDDRFQSCMTGNGWARVNRTAN
jgi:hypothetical protein